MSFAVGDKVKVLPHPSPSVPGKLSIFSDCEGRVSQYEPDIKWVFIVFDESENLGVNKDLWVQEHNLVKVTDQ